MTWSKIKCKICGGHLSTGRKLKDNEIHAAATLGFHVEYALECKTCKLQRSKHVRSNKS